jgi:hypothetical protein
MQEVCRGGGERLASLPGYPGDVLLIQQAFAIFGGISGVANRSG